MIFENFKGNQFLQFTSFENLEGIHYRNLTLDFQSNFGQKLQNSNNSHPTKISSLQVDKKFDSIFSFAQNMERDCTNESGALIRKERH